VSWAGNPILLDGSVPQDADFEAQIQAAGKEVIESSKKEVGKTRVFLDGSSATCRLQECNLGNLIADAMVDMVNDADDGGMEIFKQEIIYVFHFTECEICG